MISSSTQFKPTQYAPVRVNNPLSYYNLMEANVGDWFNDQSVIVWSRDNQAMRVVSDENKVYTLSAKLYNEAKAKKFSDFILYTKPLAARGTKDLDLIEQLAERFDQDFIMLDEIVIDLSDINLPKNSFFKIISKEKNTTIIADSKFGHICILRSSINNNDINTSTSIIRFNVFFNWDSNSNEFVTDCLEIELLPL